MKRLFLLASLAGLVLTAALPAQTASAQTSDDMPPDEDWFTACHLTEDGDYRVISFPKEVEVPQHRIDEHRAHGDLFPGESVPLAGGPGKYLNADCEPVSWLLGVTFSGCVAAVGSEEPCLRAHGEGDELTATYEPSGSAFVSETAVVQDPEVEFSSADGAVSADFDGDHLTLKVEAGQPAMDFVFLFGAWDLWDFYEVGTPSLGVLDAVIGPRSFAVTTQSTVGAAGPQSVTYRMDLEHSAGISPFRQSTIEVEPASMPADGVSTAKVTLSLRNVVGEVPAEERIVELFMNQQFGTIGPVTYVGDGVYTATITAGLAPGTATIVAMVDYSDLDLTEGTFTLTPLDFAEPGVSPP